MAEEVIVREWDQMIHTDYVLNSNHTYRHWSHKAKRVEHCKDLGRVQSLQLPKFKIARLDVEVYYPIAWKADAANYYPTMKAYVDGLVNLHPVTKLGQGILFDDNDKYFSGPFLTKGPGKSGVKGWFRFHCKLTGIRR